MADNIEMEDLQIDEITTKLLDVPEVLVQQPRTKKYPADKKPLLAHDLNNDGTSSNLDEADTNTAIEQSKEDHADTEKQAAMEKKRAEMEKKRAAMKKRLADNKVKQAAMGKKLAALEKAQPVSEPGVTQTTVDTESKMENEIDETIDGGDLNKIIKTITPHNLTKCKTNSLEKSFEVSCRLRELADSKGPDADDLESLSNSVADYAFHLLKPLQSNEMRKAIFQGKDFDRIVDKSVFFTQKKFVSHPVVYDLLLRRWTGYFYHLRNSSSLWGHWFKWIFLNIWTVFDVVLFPLVFLLFYLVHLVVGFVKKKQKFDLVFLYKAAKDAHHLQKMIVLSIATVKQLGTGKNIFANSEAKESMQDSITKDLKDANSLFQNADIHSNKVLVVMMDDVSGVSSEELSNVVTSLHKQPIRVISVGVGVHPKVKELETIATNRENVILYLDDMKLTEVRDKVIGCIYQKDIYDRYVQYFNTPYFVFVRDTLSYLALLGLHFAICLQPSTLHFTALEWVVIIFFIGRLMMEINQVLIEKVSNTKVKNIINFSKPNKDNQPTQSSENKMKKLLKMLSRYIRDQWNILDVVILTVFVVLFILRCVTWSLHFYVFKNRLLAIAGYLYGLNSIFLSLRVFGHIMELKKSTGSIQIALYQIIGAVVAIFGQFLAVILAFSLAITKVYMAEVSFTAGTNATSHGFCGDRNGGLSCWWSSTAHLTWSVLGIADHDPLNSSDVASYYLAKLLYGTFLLVSVVMLINMMIALLSNTYQQVQDNAFYEWSYKKAITIRTYTKYHPVPVPFNIISLLFKLLLCVNRRICGSKCTDTESGDQDEVEGPVHKIGQPQWFSKSEVKRKSRASLFDCIIVDLEAEYFAVNGYKFPMADENKIDRVLKDTEGSHQLIGHIAQQVFRYNLHEENQLESHHIPKWESKGIDVTGQRMSYGLCVCLDCVSKDEIRHHGIKYLTPLSRDLPEFEVLIQESGERRLISIGVVTENYKLHKYPGWDGDTAGYHIDDGKICDSRDPLGRECDDAMAHRGDLIGCQILYARPRNGKLPVSFTLNGRVVGEAEVSSSSTNFYAYVGIGCEGISLVFRWLPRKLNKPIEGHSDRTTHLLLENVAKQLGSLIRKQEELEKKVDLLLRNK